MLEHIEKEYEIKPGETTTDGRLSLLTARCLGSCGLAPVAVFDGEVEGNLAPELLAKRLAEWGEEDV